MENFGKQRHMQKKYLFLEKFLCNCSYNLAIDSFNVCNPFVDDGAHENPAGSTLTGWGILISFSIRMDSRTSHSLARPFWYWHWGYVKDPDLVWGIVPADQLVLRWTWWPVITSMHMQWSCSFSLVRGEEKRAWMVLIRLHLHSQLDCPFLAQVWACFAHSQNTWKPDHQTGCPLDFNERFAISKTSGRRLFDPFLISMLARILFDNRITSCCQICSVFWHAGSCQCSSKQTAKQIA